MTISEATAELSRKLVRPNGVFSAVGHDGESIVVYARARSMGELRRLRVQFDEFHGYRLRVVPAGEISLCGEDQ